MGFDSVLLSGNTSVVEIKKRSLLQFLPESLSSLSKISHFYFNDKKLKSGYVIDIVHNLLLKYFLKGGNKISLSSVVLKDKYGHLYNYYINYLVEEKIIFLEKNYLKGSNSRIYSLNERIIFGEISRFRNSDKVLVKKFHSVHYEIEMANNNTIHSDIKKKMISDLYSVDINIEKASFYLSSLKNKDNNYHRSKYSSESINEKHIFYHFDKYGRMHTNFTILKSFIRKNCLLIDGEETCEVDIKNSQPFFLSVLISLTDSNWVNKKELEFFKELVFSGNYYQYIMESMFLESKDEAKSLTYKVFFGQNRKNSSSDRKFSNIFPSIHFFIKLYKKEYSDYRVLAHHLQKYESNVIYNKIIRRVMSLGLPIKMITVHDSIIFQRRWKDIVSKIFYEEISLLKSNGF